MEPNSNITPENELTPFTEKYKDDITFPDNQEPLIHDNIKKCYLSQDKTTFIKQYIVKEFELKKYLREITLATRAYHPCVSQISGYFFFNKDNKSNDFCPIVFYKYYNRGFGKKTTDLLNLIRDTTIPKISECQRDLIFYGIARGLDYIHKVGIAHRNIHCNTILIDADNKQQPKWYYPHIGGFYYSKDKQDPNLSLDPEINKAGLLLQKLPTSDDNGSLNQYEPADDVYYVADIFCHFFKNSVKKFMVNQDAIPPDYQNLIVRMSSSHRNDRPKMNEVTEEIEKIIRKNNDPKGDFIKIFNEYISTIELEEINNLRKVRSQYIQFGDFISTLMTQTDQSENEKFIYNSNQKIDIKKYIKLYFALYQIKEYNPFASIFLAQIHLFGLYDFPKDLVRGCKYLNETLSDSDIVAIQFKNLIHDEILRFEYPKNPLIDLNTIREIVQLKKSSQPSEKQLQSKEGILMQGMIEEAKGEYETARELYMRSAEKGCLQAMGRLACLFQYDHSLIGIDNAEQLLLTTLGIDQQNPCDINQLLAHDRKVDDEDNIGTFINIYHEKLICWFQYGLIQIIRGNLDYAFSIFKELQNASLTYFQIDSLRAMFLIHFKKMKNGDSSNSKEMSTILYQIKSILFDSDSAFQSDDEMKKLSHEEIELIQDLKDICA